MEAHLFSVDASVYTPDGDVLDATNVKPRASELLQLFFFRVSLNECLDLFWLDLVERNRRRQAIEP